jgi:hypothetical protein
MALNTTNAFSSGFERGFGLYGAVQDRELKKDALQYNKEKDSADLAYTKRKDSQNLGLKRQEAEDLAKFRRGSLKNDSDQNALTGQAALVRARTAQLTQQGTNTKNQTELLKQEQLADPNSAASLKMRSETEENQAQREKYRAEADRVANQTNRFSAASNVREIYDLASTSDGMFDASTLERIEGMYQANKGAGVFNLGTVSADIHQRGTMAISTFMTDLAQGADPEMSPEVLRAFTTALGIDSSAAIGRTVDSTFTNAPRWIQQGNYEVVSQGLFSAGATPSKGANGEVQNTLNGEMYVELKNKDDSDDIQYYFPPLTENRSSKNSKSLNLNLDEVAQAAAGTSYYIQQVGPAIKPAVKQARIMAKYGNDSGDNGVEKFNQRVTAELESNRKAIQNGASTSSFFNDPTLTKEQALSETQMATMKHNIEDRILFGAEVQPKQVMVNKWLDETKSALTQQKIPVGRNKFFSLSSIPDEDWSPQLISNLNGYFDETQEGEVVINNQDGLLRELQELKFLTL